MRIDLLIRTPTVDRAMTTPTLVREHPGLAILCRIRRYYQDRGRARRNGSADPRPKPDLSVLVAEAIRAGLPPHLEQTARALLDHEGS